MKQYVENKYEHDSEPMLNWKDLQIVLSYIEQLENRYNKALEILSDYNMPCEYEKPIIPDEYCEENCEASDEVYKKCWNKYIELILKGDSDEFRNN